MFGESVTREPARVGRLQLAATIALLAFLVRAWHPGALGIGHYDEGVYAISASGVATWPAGHLFPGQVRFAPPAWFALLGVLARISHLPPDVVGLWLNVAFGALLAGVTCWLAVARWGSGVGAAAGMLVAFNPLAVMLSRSGLTDTLFSLLFLLGLAATIRGLESGGWRRLVLAGALVGGAWNTKYHGWFVLVIAAGAVGLGAITPARDWPALLRRVRRLAVVGVIAFACYLPWFLYMRHASGSGGLGGIAQYYLTLIGEGWWTNAVRHLSMQLAMDTMLGRLAAPGALLAALLLSGRSPAPARWGGLLLCLVAAELVAGGTGGWLALALVGAFGLRDRLSDLPTAALLCWVGLWVVAAPLYHPYARLLLPVVPAVAFLAAVGAARLVSWAAVERQSAGRGTAVLVSVTAGVVIAAAPTLSDGIGDPWRDARGSQRIAAAVADRVAAGTDVSVLGEPSIGYHLAQRGMTVHLLSQDLDALDTVTSATALLTGPYAQAAPALRQAIARLRPRLDSIATYDLDPNDLRLLDDRSPAEFRAYRNDPASRTGVVLYLLRPVVPPVPAPSGS